eukprot:403332014
MTCQTCKHQGITISNQCGIQKVIDIRRRNKSIDYSATISTHRKQNSILLNEIKTELQNPEYNVSSTTGFYQQRNIKYPQRFTQNYHYQQQLQNQQISQNLLVSPKQQHRIQQRLRNKPRKKYIHLSNLPSDFTISSTHLDQHNNNNGVDEYTIHLQSPKKTSILNKRQKSFELLRQENRADLEEQLVKLNNTLMEYQQSTQHLRNNSVSLLQQNINNQVDKKVQNKHKKSSKSSANLVQALNTTFNPTNRLTQQQQTTKESILQDQPNKPQFLFKKRKSKHRKHNKSQIFKMLLGEGDLMNNEHRDIIKRKIIEMNEKSTQKFTAMLDGTIKPKRSLLILEDNVKRNKAITKIV